MCLLAFITALYLSWYGDPTTTMTIQWHSPAQRHGDTVRLVGPDGEKTVTGTHRPFPDELLLIHTLSLQDLTPDTEYTFQIGNDPNIYRFRTAPKELPIRFAIGGDLYASPKLFRKMSKTVAAQNPLFVVLGGDLAYALGTSKFRSPAKQWRAFLSEWTKLMVAKNNRLIPFLVVPGNHDIKTDEYQLFFDLFAFPKHQLYRAVDFANYLSLILLDTDHFQPIQGRQTHWLKEALAARQEVPFLFAVYHKSAYPSFYPYDGAVPAKIRSHWCPLFDQYGVQAAFEHHNHALKKTYPIKSTTYFGDGCWGGRPRMTQEYWYLESRARKNNVYIIDMDTESASVKALGLNGETLSETAIPLKLK